VIAFGDPWERTTFSGYANSLCSALRAGDRLRHTYSAKQIRIADVFRGAIELPRSGNGFRRPTLSRRWLWRAATSQRLSERLCRSIEAKGDVGWHLQVGTLVNVDRELGPSAALTDMTIVQAHRAGSFAVGQFTPRMLQEAIDVQCDVVQRASHVFALSQWTKDSLVTDCGVPDDRVTVVYAGANVARAMRTCEDAQRRPEVLFVGIDWVRKGGPQLLEAFNLIRQRLPEASLRIVGCRPEAAGGLPGVYVEGFLSRKMPEQASRIEALYAQATCFCLPSLFDPFPNAIIEASTFGLPTVAFDNGSRREAVVHGQTGLLVPLNDVGGLASAIEQLLRNPGLAGAMGKRAEEHARSNFTWPLVVARIGAVLEGAAVADLT